MLWMKMKPEKYVSASLLLDYFYPLVLLFTFIFIHNRELFSVKKLHRKAIIKYPLDVMEQILTFFPQGGSNLDSQR